MADAKITLTTEAKSDGLEQLNKALAEGQQNVASMKRELKDLEKATRDGAQATKEQAAAMVELRKSINEQSATNKSYQKEIAKTSRSLADSAKAMAAGDAGARKLASSFKLTEGFTSAFSVALGSLAATITTAAVAAMAELAGQVINLGAQMQQSVAHIAAMKNNLGDATAAYQAFNDVGRNTTYSLETVQQMGIQLMNMGYSAQNAASLIQLCADTAAGLGQGQEGAMQLVDTLSRIQATGEMSSRQLIALQMAGMDMDKAFASIGMTAEEAFKAMDKGTLDSKTAVQALTNYMHEFDGSMAKSKDNTIDAWSDVTGNLQTMCAEIGNGIFDAFNQSGIIQELIDFTQSMIDMIRGDGCGAFSDLKAIAGEVLSFIGGLLGFVLDTIKLIIIAVNDVYGAFKSFGSQVISAVQPAVDVVMALYDAVKLVLSSVGKAFSEEVSASAKKTFGRELDPEERVNGVSWIDVPTTPRTTGSTVTATRTGGGGGGGRSSTASAERAEREAEEAARKAAEAAKKAYEEEFNSIKGALNEESKTLLDAFLGDPNSAASKIAALKDQLATEFEAIDKAAAMSEQMAADGQEGALNPLAAILNKSPELLAEEMAAKGETIADFVQRYKEDQAKLREAEAQSIKTGESWHDSLVSYAKGVAGEMSNAMMDIITGAKSGKEALADFVKALLKNALQLLTQWLALFAIFSIVGEPRLAARNASAALFGAGDVNLRTDGKAQGGLITGPGTGTSDSIPMMLSNGEYVLRSDAVDRIGVGTLNALNAGAVPELPEGGAMAGGSVTLNVSTMDASSFADFLNRGGLDGIRQALFENNRGFGSEVGVW